MRAYSLQSSLPMLPEELFLIILENFHAREVEREASPYRFREEQDTEWNEDGVYATKRQIGQCSLVCRYWARVCRRQLFDRLTLRSRQDYLELLAMVSSPSSMVGEYVCELQLVCAFPLMPWVHLVPLQLRQYCPSLDELCLVVKGPLLLQQLKHGIHTPLPRHTPAFSEGIVSLHLNGMQCDSLQDVIRLLLQLPSLSALDCSNISWKAVPLDQDLAESSLLRYVGRPRRTSSRKISCQIVQCEESWAALPICYAVLRQNKEFRLPYDYFFPAAMIIRVMMRDIEPAIPELDLQTSVRRERLSMICLEHDKWDWEGRWLFEITIDFEYDLEAKFDGYGCPNDVVEKAEFKLTFSQLDPSEVGPLLDGIAWEEIDKFLFEFPQIPSLVISPEWWYDDWDATYARIRSRMPLLASMGDWTEYTKEYVHYPKNYGRTEDSNSEFDDGSNSSGYASNEAEPETATSFR